MHLLFVEQKKIDLVSQHLGELVQQNKQKNITLGLVV